MGVDLSGVRKEQFAVQSKKKQIKDKLTATEKKLESLQEELKAVTQKRDKAYQTILELRKQHDEEVCLFFASNFKISVSYAHMTIFKLSFIHEELLSLHIYIFILIIFI